MGILGWAWALFPENIPKRLTWLITLPGVFWLVVLLLHASLPLHSDISVFVVLTTFLALLLAWKGKQQPRIPITGCARTAIVGVVFMFAATGFTTALHPETAAAASKTVLWIGCILSGIILSRALPGHRYAFLGALAIALLASALFGCAVENLRPESVGLWHDGRLKLFAIHPSRLAQYCAAAMFWSLNSCLTVQNVSSRVVYGLFLTALSVMFFLTNTRAMIVAFPVALICLAPVLATSFRKGLIMILGGLVLAGGICLVLFPEAGGGYRLRSALSAPFQDPTFRSRLPIWEAGWNAFIEAPLLGHGVKTFRERHKSYRLAHESEWRVRFPGYETSIKHAHNIFLGRLVETGIVGCLGFVLFFAGVIGCAFTGPPKECWIAGLFIFFLVAGMMDDPLFRVNDIFIFFAAGSVLGNCGWPRKCNY